MDRDRLRRWRANMLEVAGTVAVVAGVAQVAVWAAWVVAGVALLVWSFADDVGGP